MAFDHSLLGKAVTVPGIHASVAVRVARVMAVWAEVGSGVNPAACKLLVADAATGKLSWHGTDDVRLTGVGDG